VRGGKARQIVLFLAAAALSPVAVAAFRACVEALKNPDLKTRLFGHGESMLFFFAGLFLYLAVHLLLPSQARKAVVSSEPGGAFWRNMTGGEDGVAAAALSMAFPVLAAAAVAVFYVLGVIWEGVEDFFPLLMFVVGLAVSLHFACGLERLLSNAKGRPGTAFLSVVLAVALACEFTVALLALLTGKLDWTAYNRRVYELAAAAYLSAWEWLRSLLPEKKR